MLLIQYYSYSVKIYNSHLKYHMDHILHYCFLIVGLVYLYLFHIFPLQIFQIIEDEIDIELLKRFNQPGPRYTSYPTAPVFSTEFTNEDFEREVVETNRDNASPLSLYFHFPHKQNLAQNLLFLLLL